MPFLFALLSVADCSGHSTPSSRFAPLLSQSRNAIAMLAQSSITSCLPCRDMIIIPATNLPESAPPPFLSRGILHKPARSRHVHLVRNTPIPKGTQPRARRARVLALPPVGVGTIDPQGLRFGRLLPGQAPALLPRRDAGVLAALDDDVTVLDAAAEEGAEVLRVVIVFAVFFLEGCEGVSVMSRPAKAG